METKIIESPSKEQLLQIIDEARQSGAIIEALVPDQTPCD